MYFMWIQVYRHHEIKILETDYCCKHHGFVKANKANERKIWKFFKVKVSPKESKYSKQTIVMNLVHIWFGNR